MMTEDLQRLLRFCEGMEDGDGRILASYPYFKRLAKAAGMKFCGRCGWEHCDCAKEGRP
jgi:hypothetical protein